MSRSGLDREGINMSEQLKYVSPEYQARLERLAALLMTPVQTEAVRPEPIVLERTDMGQQDFNRWCDQGTYLERL